MSRHMRRYRQMKAEKSCVLMLDGCEGKAQQGKVHCKTCSRVSSSRQRASREAKLARGECLDCKEPAEKDRGRCRACLNHRADWWREHKRGVGEKKPMSAEELSTKARDAWL